MTELSIWREAFRILCEDVPEFRYPEWFEYLADQIPAGIHVVDAMFPDSLVYSRRLHCAAVSVTGGTRSQRKSKSTSAIIASPSAF